MPRLWPYLLLSLLIHCLLFFLTKIPWMPNQDTPSTQTIWVDLQKGKYEVVDILSPALEQKPDEAKFLGMQDSKADQPMVASLQGRTLEENSKLETRNSKIKKPKEDSLSYFGQKQAMGGEMSEESLAEDYLPDFRRGPHTYLNVLRFPDIQYFVMLKRVFKMTFDPLPPLREAYFQNRITRGKIETVLGVSIDAKGQLAELFVFSESGIKEFDQETLRTIRASAPFMIPPAKLLDQEGLLRMSWTFSVYL